jgi:predicted N-formylglutamate amidohydrolase
MKHSFVVTCEHAGNEVPEEYEYLFTGYSDMLASHKGWDPGALQLAEFLAEHLCAPLYSCSLTRLLIETNRSIDSPQLFSKFTTELSREEKIKLLTEIYYEYRNEVEEKIAILTKPLIHLSIHSFTPVWNERVRDVDIGILFDPDRKFESLVCDQLKLKLVQLLPDLNIRFNEPYSGTDDGFTTYLRTKFNDAEYAGIEIEMNQKFVETDEWFIIQSALLKVMPLEYDYPASLKLSS